MSDWKETNRLRELQEEVAAEKGMSTKTMMYRNRFHRRTDSNERRISCINRTQEPNGGTQRLLRVFFRRPHR